MMMPVCARTYLRTLNRNLILNLNLNLDLRPAGFTKMSITPGDDEGTPGDDEGDTLGATLAGTWGKRGSQANGQACSNVELLWTHASMPLMPCGACLLPSPVQAWPAPRPCSSQRSRGTRSCCLAWLLPAPAQGPLGPPPRLTPRP